MIYLDNAATTAMHREVLEAMMPYLEYSFGNPGSIHQLGREAAAVVDTAREQVARFLGAESPEQIIFTSGGTEGNNMVFAGLEERLRRCGRTDILVSAVEHDSVWKSAHRLGGKPGFTVHVIDPTGDGEIVVDAVDAVLSDQTGLVSVMMANNETGVKNAVRRICRHAQTFGALFHTDAVQAAGVMPMDAQESAYDFLTVSSHKIHGPKGVGALYARDPAMLSPMIVGGASQEFGFRGGTENVAGIVGFGKACELAFERYSETYSKISSLRETFWRTLCSRLSPSQMHLNGVPYLSTVKTMSICFPGIDANTLLILLDSQDVCVSAGSACRAHEEIPSRVLMSMGISAEDARSSIRVSFSEQNTVLEVLDAAAIIADCVRQLHSLSAA